MKRSHLRQFGHACCPNCKEDFDLTNSYGTFLEAASYGDTLVYYMCPECHETFKSATPHVQKEMSNTCFVNFKLTVVDPNDGVFPWAVTSTLTLALNDYDMVSAFENGHGLTKKQYLDICAGKYEISVALGGLRFITSTEKETGAK
jgi:hypothetical protein